MSGGGSPEDQRQILVVPWERMRLFSRKDRAATMAERPLDPEEEFPGSDAELLAGIRHLVAVNRGERTLAVERQLLRLRHLAGVRLLDRAPADPQFPPPAFDQLPQFGGELPEIPAAQLTPELVRAGILRDGCLLVRGLVDRDEALRLAMGIDRSFDEREHHDAGEPVAKGFYEEFVQHPRFDPYLGRPWIKMGGGVYAADSPVLSFEMVDVLQRSGVPQLVSGYLGETAVISVHKTTLRRAEPTVPGTWHQDGKFMGSVRSLNLWLSLSHCGDDAPGLDIVPRRLDRHVTTQTEEATLDTQVSQTKAEEAAGERGILRPSFKPGDALLFDELFLHKTASERSMTRPRFAIEIWFFGTSGFPETYAPIAV